MPEKPKEPEKPKVEPPKVETPKVAEKPKELEEAKAAPPPSTEAPPTVAPPAAEMPAFEFEGGKTVETSSDPVKLYQGAVEYLLRSKWNRPDDLPDDKYVAEVDVTVSRTGAISNPVWRKSSGDPKWDDSVRQAIAAVKAMDRSPPTNFPPQILVRFDVQDETEPINQ
jgi:outer membrane biosynthesis protein TonB